MNKERIKVLAQNAAKQMVDKTITIEQRMKAVETPEIKALDNIEYNAFRDMMIRFMKELAKSN